MDVPSRNMKVSLPAIVRFRTVIHHICTFTQELYSYLANLTKHLANGMHTYVLNSEIREYVTCSLTSIYYL